MRRLQATTPLSRKLMEHRSALIDVAARHHARDVRVFGSVTRREDSAASDVDLIVTLDPDAKPLDLIALACDAKELLGVRGDVGTIQSLRQHLRGDVLADIVTL